MKNWWKYRNITDVIAAFEQQFSGAPTPRWQVIYKLSKMFEQTGSVNDKLQSGLLRSFYSVENMKIIPGEFLKFKSPQIFV